MAEHTRVGMIILILLIGFILIGAVSASIILTTTGEISDEGLNRITSEAVDEICSYLQIKNVLGKYHFSENQQKITQIAIQIKPLVSQSINISHIIVQLSNGEEYTILFYNGISETIQNHSLFKHPLWSSIQVGTYSILSILDDDSSIARLNLINKNTDVAFILLILPEYLALKNGDQLTVTILPSPGVGRTITLEAPLPIHPIVSLY
jgi:archaellin